jgi:cytochrome c-type biogenesis protein CcmH
MTLFVAVCVLLLALSGIFFLIPTKKREGSTDEDLERANLEWYQLRRQELAEEGNDSLAADAQLRLLEDEQVPEGIHSRQASGRGFPAWALLPVVAVFSVAMYYQLGGAQDVLISRQLQSLDDTSTPQQMEALMQTIEKRAAQRPDNLHYIAMLGRFYMGAQDYAKAAQAYDELTLAAPEDAAGLAYAAQARYLAAGRVLDDSAKVRAEQALAIDPHQRTALGLLGMAAYEQGQYRAAIGYWQRLLAVESPGSESQRMIAGIIDSAREKLGEPVPAAAEVAATPVPAGDSSLGVTVSVALPAGSGVEATDTVFVLARDAASDSRMPIAVKRLRGADLPLTLRLDDSNSMAGQKLSQTDSVLVVVQVSPGGGPGEANATWLGRAGPLAPTSDGGAVNIVLVPANGISES